MVGDVLARLAVITAALLTLTSCGKETYLTGPDTAVTEAVSENTGGSAVDDYIAESTASAPSEEIFRLDISIKEGEDFPDKYVTEGFETVLQNPELPTGCEVTALCQLLRYLGFDIDKVELADEFMPMDNIGVTTMKNAYIGDPKTEEGFGCSAPVIVRTADDYFQSVKSPCYAEELTGRSLKELCYQVAQGRPVIVWSTIDLIISPPNYWWTDQEGEEMWFNDFQHCVVMYGYDFEENTVHIADPLVGNVKYDMDRFKAAYELMGEQAVLICGDSETEGMIVPLENKPQSAILSRNEAERRKAEKGKEQT